MPRYAAFLRGVMPTNAKMPELAATFAAAGFTEVRTVLASGNVVFSARAAAERTLERRAEEAMAARLGRTFLTIVRPVDALRELLAADPWDELGAPGGEKRVVTFLREPPARLPELPLAEKGVHVLSLRGREVLTTYRPGPKGGEFMLVLERALGKEITTRTWDTVAKVAR